MDQIPELFVPGIAWWQYLLALVAVVVGFVLSGFARRAALKLLRRTAGISEPLADALSRFASYLVIFLGFGVGLALIGANLQPVLAIFLLVGVVAILVVKGFSDNFAAGVLLQARHPFVPGDELTVEIADGVATGIVQELGSRTVVITTYDGRTVHVPNSRLIDGPIVCVPADGVRRSALQVRIERDGAATDALLARVAEVTAEVDGVDGGTPPAVRLETVSPQRITATVLYWHTALNAAAVTSDVVARLAAQLEAAGLRCTISSAPGTPAVIPPDAL